jgi:hypothetical protein
VLFIVDPKTLYEFWFDSQIGRLIFGQNSNKQAYYDGAWRGTQLMTTGKQVVLYSLKNGEAKIERTGVTLDSGLAYTQRAIGGSTHLGARYDGNAQWSDIGLKCMALYKGKNDADSAAIMATARAIYGV